MVFFTLTSGNSYAPLGKTFYSWRKKLLFLIKSTLDLHSFTISYTMLGTTKSPTHLFCCQQNDAKNTNAGILIALEHAIGGFCKLCYDTEALLEIQD